jgi:thioredoxin-like negative regulator of GroEL
MSVPTFRVYKGGRALDEFVGASKQHLEAFIKGHVNTVVPEGLAITAK